MKRLKVAVIGFGVMGKYHANVYAALPHTDLVAVVDPDPGRCIEAETSYDVRSFTHPEAVLKNVALDAVSIAAPTSLHYDLTKTFLEAGVHVLVEKPAATDVAQAQKLANLSRRRGLILQVGHITRFYRSIQLLSERVREPYLIEARRLTPNARIKDAGAILDLMIHDIDILLGLVQSDIEEVTVAGKILNGSLYEDVAAAQIVFKNGCIARLLASRVAPDAERSLVIAEAKQTLRLDFGKDPHTEIAVYQPVGDDTGNNHVNVDRIVVREDNPLRSELEHFLARIRGTEPPIGTLDDDLRSLRLATRLIQQLKAKRPAELSY
ncbi:MAG: Gfo/Idh/MocA family oxidoreductase [Deinococcota bacterium]|nr:Gfo/Idh/MocA family oxidoreductase [Deinococcota bacterium]